MNIFYLYLVLKIKLYWMNTINLPIHTGSSDEEEGGENNTYSGMLDFFVLAMNIILIINYTSAELKKPLSNHKSISLLLSFEFKFL